MYHDIKAYSGILINHLNKSRHHINTIISHLIQYFRFKIMKYLILIMYPVYPNV